MRSLHKPILFSALEKYVSLLFYMVSSAILARLLSPMEFGICSIALALTNILTSYFQEFGGANYLIQKSVLSPRNIRTAFTVTSIAFFCVAALLYVLADLAASFFKQDTLQVAIFVCSINLALSPVPMTLSALLRREMEFAALARCNLGANFLAAVSSVVFAVRGWSFLAPILGMLVGTIARNVLMVASRPQLSIFRPSLRAYGEVFEFGAYSSSVVIINVFAVWFPQLVLGRVLDFSAVGLYSRAVNITQLFDKFCLQILAPVILPAISAHARSGGDLRKAYLDGLELLSCVHWSSLLFIAMMADEMIRIWLGSTWMDVVPLVQVMSIASLSMFAACLTYPVLVGIGRVQDTLTSSLISLPPCLLLTALAAFSGVQAVANVALITLPFQAAVAIWFIARRLTIGPLDLLHACSKSAIVALLCTLGAGLGRTTMVLSGAGPIGILLMAGAVGAAGWLVGVFVTNHPLLTHMRALTQSFPLPRRAIFR
jgi:O-antigen/teichoic acid export membrane protein